MHHQQMKMRHLSMLNQAGLWIILGTLLAILSHWFPRLLNELGTWPMILAFIGLIMGIYSKFRHPLSIALILIGGICYYKVETPLYTVWYLLPLALITSGILIHFVTKGPMPTSKHNMKLNDTENDTK